jgi:hypothetical protein
MLEPTRQSTCFRRTRQPAQRRHRAERPDGILTRRLLHGCDAGTRLAETQTREVDYSRSMSGGVACSCGNPYRGSRRSLKSSAMCGATWKAAVIDDVRIQQKNEYRHRNFFVAQNVAPRVAWMRANT